MARSIKTKGLEELYALKRRVNRQYALGRIGARDREFLIKHINFIDARIAEMRELNENGEEEGF